MADTRLTIDNLGIGTSSRYARDQATLDTKLIKDSHISKMTEVSVVKPYVSAEFDQFSASDKQASWALFAPPPDAELSSGLFSYQLIPSLGGYEKQEGAEEKLEALEDSLNKEEKEKERKVLIRLLKQVKDLDQILGMIRARCNQYHKG
jgi:hypothetical protein